MTRRTAIVVASALALVLSGRAWAQTDRNILMIIADDVGVDMIGAYQPAEQSTQVPSTPEIDTLGAQGIVFLNAWSNPVCAVTRATIQTGRYGYRNGVLGVEMLDTAEFSIPEILRRDAALDYTQATFGKWGLGRTSTRHPVLSGYDFFAGRPDNRITTGYFEWEKHTAQFDPASSCDPADPAWHEDETCIAASVTTSTTYATTENVDDTLAWIDTMSSEPWFVILSFNAAHLPYHVPPGFPPTSCAMDEPSCYRAMIEAMDIEIGRLLDGLSPALLANTTIIFLGDNGSPTDMAAPPFIGRRAKFTLYEGGINVPLIVKGADVLGTPRDSQALVNTSDLFMTVLELAGLDPSALPATDAQGDPWRHDSVSLAPILADDCSGGCSVESVREYVYSEAATGSAGKTIRDRAGYKLKVSNTGAWEFFSLTADPFELSNLVDPAAGDLLVADPQLQPILDDLRWQLGEVGFPPNLAAANLAPNADTDADGIADDGDGSGVAGDARCLDGQTTECDDNCPKASNPGQEDADGDGLGDACDAVCNNGLDDDGDGAADYSADPGCSAAASSNEAPQCNDGADNEGDGLTDFDGGQSIHGACSGGVCPPGVSDPDGDGQADPDPVCTTAWRDGEGSQCQDGNDNDLDGLVDFDGGQSIHGVCSGGVCPPGVSDTNGDGEADPDPHCSNVLDNMERQSSSRRCGLGAELAVLVPLLMWLFGKRSRKA